MTIWNAVTFRDFFTLDNNTILKIMKSEFTIRFFINEHIVI
ncbi:hypothetical protein V3H44_23055 [Vibrio parahaemolyticus]